MTSRTPSKSTAIILIIVAMAAVGWFFTRPLRHPRVPPAPVEPFGPIRSIAQVRQDAVSLTGKIVRVRGRLTAIRDLNPGERFPWDVVYTVQDATGQIPVHWFTQEKSPKDLRPPTMPQQEVIVTGKVKRDLDLDGTKYPVILHELAEWHNQEHPILPATPVAQ
jgi:hypothetical protein